jgi:hypothetical protein
MERLGIIEVGSTFTKPYFVDGSIINAGDIVDLPLKAHYDETGAIAEGDADALCSLVQRMARAGARVHVYGTSIFRTAPADVAASLRHRLRSFGAEDFTVVSADMESDFTSIGVLSALKYPGPIGVFVGGGGSTEVSVRDASGTIARANTPLGVGDVNREFPDLSEEIASSDPLEVVRWISQRLVQCDARASLLVLAGGDFPLLYKNAGYALRPNPHALGPEAGLLLSNQDKNLQDRILFQELGLSRFRKLTPKTPNWWNGTRAMCCLVAAVASQIGAELLVPTRISMVNGIAAQLRQGRPVELQPEEIS